MAEGGRIAFVGSDVEAAAVAGSDAAVVDLGGRVVVPGFIDAHTHLVMMGEALDGSFPANHPEYAVPLEDAVAHATRDAAASCLEDHERGRIAPGLAADFAVLDRDPFAEGADVLLEARVVRTVVAGVTAYEAAAASVA